MEAPLRTRVTPTWGDRPKDGYWASLAGELWKQVRGNFLPRMQAGERTIQAFMREPMTTEVATMWVGRMPETEDVDPVIFDYDEVQPSDGSARYWAVEARTEHHPWLMETGDLARRAK